MTSPFHRNLLLLLSAGLCGLCAYQWRIQSAQRVTIGQLTRTVENGQLALRDATNTIRRADDQVAQLDSQVTTLQDTLRTSEQTLATQKRELQRLQTNKEAMELLVAEYKQVIEGLQAKLKDAYAGIEKQNAAFATLVAQRDDLVAKLNASMADRNDVVNQYNELAKRVEKLQAALTNPPAVQEGPKP